MLKVIPQYNGFFYGLNLAIPETLGPRVKAVFETVKAVLPLVSLYAPGDLHFFGIPFTNMIVRGYNTGLNGKWLTTIWRETMELLLIFKQDEKKSSPLSCPPHLHSFFTALQCGVAAVHASHAKDHWEVFENGFKAASHMLNAKEERIYPLDRKVAHPTSPRDNLVYIVALQGLYHGTQAVRLFKDMQWSTLSGYTKFLVGLDLSVKVFMTVVRLGQAWQIRCLPKNGEMSAYAKSYLAD
jgi:hypothetical protein